MHAGTRGLQNQNLVIQAGSMLDGMAGKETLAPIKVTLLQTLLCIIFVVISLNGTFLQSSQMF